MKAHWKYLKYVLRHKWYVALFLLKAQFTLGNLWRAIVHDLSKFYPSEWMPYANYFYGFYAGMSKEEIAHAEHVAFHLGISIKTRDQEKAEFDVAWLHHQKRNKHHWQYWMLTRDDGGTVCLPMPEKYIQEMIADWHSAGFCITGKHEYKEWYRKNQNKIQFHPETRKRVDFLLLGIQEVVIPEFYKP
jgi:hypothetical protein